MYVILTPLPALCGVSSEVEQISRRKKNGLVSEYLILMKAVAKYKQNHHMNV